MIYKNNFNVSQDDENKRGVYIIQLNNIVYIGSTILTFKKRFVGHTSKNSKMIKTRDLIEIN